MGIKNNLDLKEAIKIIEETDHLLLEGIYTDLTTIGVEDEFYYQSINNFYQIISNYLDKDLLIHSLDL